MELISTFIFFIVMTTGGAAFAVFGVGRFEEGVSSGQTAVMLFMFAFGVMGLLRLSVILLMVLCGAVWVLILLRLLKKAEGGAAATRLFTPAFFLYLAMAVWLLAVNFGKVLASHDEFSHWGDVVRGMSVSGMLGYEPAVKAAFPHYPPGISLLEYIPGEINRLLGAYFEEWQLYYAFQLYFFSLFFPFISKMDFKKPLPYFTLAGLFLIPSFFQPNVYSMILVDELLAVLYGTGLAMLLSAEERERERERERSGGWFIRLLLIIAALPLVKSAGMLFAVSLFICLCYEQMRDRGRAALPLLSGGLALLALPTIVWNIMVKLKGVKEAFGYSALLLGESVSGINPADTAVRFVKALFTRNLTVSGSILPHATAAAYFVILILLLVLLNKKAKDREKATFMNLAVVLTGIAYISGICVIMCFSFSAEEVYTLSAYERYINAFFSAVSMEIFLTAVERIRRGELKPGYITAGFTVVALLLTPIWSTLHYVAGREVSSSRNFRACSLQAEDEFHALDICEGRVLVIFDNYDYTEHIILSSTLRPMELSYDVLQGRSREAVADSFDYVLLYRIPEGFAEDNADFFEPGTAIEEGALYAPVGSDYRLVRLTVEQ